MLMVGNVYKQDSIFQGVRDFRNVRLAFLVPIDLKGRRNEGVMRHTSKLALTCGGKPNHLVFTDGMQGLTDYDATDSKWQ